MISSNRTDQLANALGRNSLQTAVRLLCLAACAAMILIALLVYRANAGGILIAVAFMVIYVQLPGLFLLRMAQFRPGHISTALAVGFFTGWAFITLQYFITELIHTNALLYALGPVCTILWILQLVRERRDAREPRGTEQNLAGSGAGQKLAGPGFGQRLWAGFQSLSPALCIFLTVGLLYTMLMTQYLYLSPEVDHMITMNPDKGFHLGLINSLSHGWPLECPWFSGLYFNYHIFTELLYSVPIRLFGLTADLMLFSVGPYLTVYAFGVSLYAVFREMCARADRAGLYCLALLLSNIFIARGIDQSIAFLFIFRNENVAGYGVSGALVLIILIKYWYAAHIGGPEGAVAARSKKDSAAAQDISPAERRASARRAKASAAYAWRLFLPLLAVLMLLTGIKGPFGVVAVAALWGTWILGLILRQAKLKTILPLLILSVGFYIVYAVILGSKGQSASAGESLIALANIIDITFFKAPLVALMKSIGLPSVIRYAVLLGIFTVFLLTAFFLPFVIGYIRELILVCAKKKAFDFTRVFVYAATLVGFIAMLLLNYHGHSQIYFGFVTVFFAPLIAFWFFEDMEGNQGTLMRIIRGIFLVCLILSAIGLAGFMAGELGEAAKSADPSAPGGNRYKSISHKEYEAMRWIDKNTPKDALLATDRYYTVAPKNFDIADRWDNRYFLYADYANRICYFAGAGYNLPARDWEKRQERIRINDRFFDAADEERGDLARSLGIDYVVVSKRFTKAGDLTNQDYELCFSNKHVDVYAITY